MGILALLYDLNTISFRYIANTSCVKFIDLCSLGGGLVCIIASFLLSC